MINRLKSAFISIFPTIAFIVIISSSRSIWKNGFTYSLGGLLITALGIVSFFALLFIFKRARTDENLKVNSLIVLIGTIMGTYGLVTQGFILNEGLTLCFLIIGWILYLRWYSIYENRDHNLLLSIGNKMPLIELENESKEKVNSSSFLGKPAIYLFYRGNWCPLCMAQIKEIADQYKALEKRGIQMVLVSPQPHKYTRSLAKKFNVGFHFLVDVKNKAARQLNILAENGLPTGFQVLGYDSDTVLPTVIITNKEGIILFADLTDNYRIRPEPATFLNIIDQHQLEVNRS